MMRYNDIFRRNLTGLGFGTIFLMLAAGAAHAENLVGNYALLRTLDKVSAETEDIRVKVGDTLKFGSLSIDVKHCEKRPPEEIPETYVFVQVFEKKTPETNRPNGEPASVKLRSNNAEASAVDPRGEKLFSGWMLASNPAISALEHRVYDVWVLDCSQ